MAPRLQADIVELKVISDELTAKYGKQYAQAVRENCLKTVNERVIHKLSADAPPKALVENYMIGMSPMVMLYLVCEVIIKLRYLFQVVHFPFAEISRVHNVPYEPDSDVLRQNEVMAAEAIAADNPLIYFDNDKKGGGSGGGGGGMRPPPIGFASAPSQPFNYPPVSIL